MGVLVADVAGALLVNPPVSASIFVFHLASTSALLTTIATVGAIFFVARRGSLESWSGGRALQFLGRISYSLYLTHVPVLELALRTAFHLSGPNHAMAVFWFVFVAGLCVGVASVFHFLVEMPAMRLANRFKTAATSLSTTPGAIAPMEISR